MRHPSQGGPQREGQGPHPPWEVARHRVRPSRDYAEGLQRRAYGGSEKERRAEERRRAMLDRKAAHGDGLGVVFDAPAASTATASAASSHGHGSADCGLDGQATLAEPEDAGWGMGASSSSPWVPSGGAAAWHGGGEAWRWGEWPCDDGRESDAEHAAQVYSDARYQRDDDQGAPRAHWRGADHPGTRAQGGAGVGRRDYSAEEKARRAALRQQDHKARQEAVAAAHRARWDASQAASAASAPAAAPAAAAPGAPGDTGGVEAGASVAGADTGGTGQPGAQGAGAQGEAPGGEAGVGEAAAGAGRFVKALQAFDGTTYGEGYLVLRPGDELQELRMEAGWMLGRLVGETREGTGGPSEGWYPPSFAS